MHFLDEHRSILLWDLDGTLIDSSHRQNTLPDGSLDLDRWIQNNTADKIMNDRLLPLIDVFRAATRSINIAVTARVLTEPDYNFFFEHGIMFYRILSRPEGCIMADAPLKEIMLRLMVAEYGCNWFEFCRRSVLLDDNQAVLKHAESMGLETIDARVLNQRLAIRKQVA
jgi:hypothetical protein